MRRPSGRNSQLTAEAEPEVISTDDGGSGLYDACSAQFPPPEFQIKCDAVHTVWIKRADGGRSVGLPPWLLPVKTVYDDQFCGP